jgi:hypothetical protein
MELVGVCGGISDCGLVGGWELDGLGGGMDVRWVPDNRRA